MLRRQRNARYREHKNIITKQTTHTGTEQEETEQTEEENLIQDLPDGDFIPCFSSDDELEEAKINPAEAIVNLGNLAVKHNITETCLADIMAYIKEVSPAAATYLPKDPRTVKKRAIQAHQKFLVEENSLVFIGVKYHLQRLFFPPETQQIIINLSTDGLPLYRSGKGQRFWPWVMQIDGLPGRVHVVAVWSGLKDPSAEELANEHFVKELRDLLINGWEGISFRIGYIASDLMAMAKLKAIISPTGYLSCYRCTIFGIHDGNKVCFMPEEAEVANERTNSSFRLHTDTEHHQPVDMAARQRRRLRKEPPDPNEKLLPSPLNGKCKSHFI